MMFHFGNVAMALLVLPVCPGVYGFQLGSRLGAATYSQKNEKLFVSSVTAEGDAGESMCMYNKCEQPFASIKLIIPIDICKCCVLSRE
jgi:hypothetical protein